MGQEVEDLGLATSAAVDHAVHTRPVLGQDLGHDRRVGPGGRQQQLPCRDWWLPPANLDGVLEIQSPAIDKLRWQCRVECLRELSCQTLAKDIVSGSREPVAAHSTVVLLLVCGLPRGCQANYHIPSGDAPIVDNVAAPCPSSDSGVHDDRANKVPDICSLATRGNDLDPVTMQLSQQLLRAANDRGYDLPRDLVPVPADGAAEQDWLLAADTGTDKVVQIHDECILCDAAPDGEVTRAAPVGVRQG
mmetsp:Transcript_23581/g.68010  ORF Transcript_23581/g.68010 Transcript_23581/m.68010 type:complete len:247 (-) Transcript_23581:271-1011(-)